MLEICLKYAEGGMTGGKAPSPFLRKCREKGEGGVGRWFLRLYPPEGKSWEKKQLNTGFSPSHPCARGESKTRRRDRSPPSR